MTLSGTGDMVLCTEGRKLFHGDVNSIADHHLTSRKQPPGDTMMARLRSRREELRHKVVTFRPRRSRTTHEARYYYRLSQEGKTGNLLRFPSAPACKS